MLAARVIPCLDVHGGRVVKGTNFVNLRDAGDPVEVARRYEAEGADELVLLDITASHEQRDIILDVVRRTAEQVFMPLTVGGGVRTIEDVRALTVGRLRQSLDQFGCLQRSRLHPAGGRSIWQPMHRRQHRPQTCPKGKRGGLGGSYPWRSHSDRIDGRCLGRGSAATSAGEIVLTSMDCDGTCDGYDLPVTAAVSEAVSIPVVASGGAGKPSHLADAIIQGKADAALAASIFHFGQFTIAETKQVMREAGITVRL